ncbi:MAG TPA: SBBP repeat-containing protein [Ignavibacteria bacterium]
MNTTISSQVAQEWLARYDGNPSFDDYASCMTIDGSNNLYIGGGIVTAENNDLVILKYSPSGQLLWSRTFNGGFSHWDEAVDILFCPSTSSIIVTGFTEYQNTCFDIVTLKYSLQGELQWVKIYHHPGSVSNKPKGLKADGAGNIYLTGFTCQSQADFLTIKYDQNGTLLWADTYSGIINNSIDESCGIFISESGNIYITGGSSGNPQNLGSLDFATIKYSSNGARQWIARYDGEVNKNDVPANLVVDSQENVYVAGKSQIDPLNSNYEYIVIKYNGGGTTEWTDHYRNSSSSEAMALTVDDQNNIYVTGNTTHSSQSTDFITVKYNPAGERLWLSYFNNMYNNWDIPEAIAVDNQYNVYVTGRGGGFSWLYPDYNTVKYSSAGIQLWSMNYNAVRGDSPVDIVVDNNYNVYVTGWSTLNEQDILTIKYSQLTGIRPVSNEIPMGFELQDNYPNPFNPATHLRFEIPELRFVNLKIFDALGKNITTLVNENLKPGRYEVTWDASNYTSGVYFYRLTADNYTDTKRMILIK